ncbi:MAG: hypothetical protein IKD33_01325 [Bacteroidales bacterium]|nr:hypothetical protein [Bacteroidales bacterium]
MVKIFFRWVEHLLVLTWAIMFIGRAISWRILHVVECKMFFIGVILMTIISLIGAIGVVLFAKKKQNQELELTITNLEKDNILIKGFYLFEHCLLITWLISVIIFIVNHSNLIFDSIIPISELDKPYFTPFLQHVLLSTTVSLIIALGYVICRFLKTKSLHIPITK